MRANVMGLLCVTIVGCFPDPPARFEDTDVGADSTLEVEPDIATELGTQAGDEIDSAPIDSTALEADADSTSAETSEAIDDAETQVPDGDTQTPDKETEGDSDVEDVEATPECTTNEQCTAAPCETARCEDGRCVFEAKQCVPIDECHQPGVCQPATGQCTTPVQGNGTPCDDGVRCTWADACTTGVCGGTRAPDDSQLDFNYTMRSSHGSRAAGLASNDTDVFIAVAFPTEEVVEGPVMVDFGRDATLAAVVVNLPASASAGIAIARYTHSGTLIEAHLAASSNAPILYTSLTWLASSGLLLTGTYESAITLTSRGGGTVELTTLSQSAATFAFDHHNRVMKAVGIEQAAPVQIPPRVVSNGTDCALIVNLMQDRAASVFDHTGPVVDTFESTGENLAEVWVAWMPACGSLTVDARHIGGGSADGSFTAYPASLSALQCYSIKFFRTLFTIIRASTITNCTA